MNLMNDEGSSKMLVKLGWVMHLLEDSLADGVIKVATMKIGLVKTGIDNQKHITTKSQ